MKRIYFPLLRCRFRLLSSDERVALSTNDIQSCSIVRRMVEERKTQQNDDKDVRLTRVEQNLSFLFRRLIRYRLTNLPSKSFNAFTEYTFLNRVLLPFTFK